MHNADSIIWAKLDRERGQWEVLNISDMEEGRMELFDNRQVLIFKSVEVEDAGTYRCYPQQNGTVFREISRKFSIEVVACDPLARGPYAIAPLPCENTVCNLGEDLVLPCNAYFGCSDGDDVRIVQWYVSRDDDLSSDWIPVTEFDPRYTVQEYNYGYVELVSQWHFNIENLSIPFLLPSFIHPSIHPSIHQSVSQINQSNNYHDQQTNLPTMQLANQRTNQSKLPNLLYPKYPTNKSTSQPICFINRFMFNKCL